MATTTATLGITSADLTPGMSLGISANTTLYQTGTTTGLELLDMGVGQLTEASGADALAEALGTANTANYIYLCNNSTDVEHYISVTIHATLIGTLGSEEWMWIPWNMGDGDAEIEIQAEPNGTIPYEYAIFKSTHTLPSAT